MRWTCHYDACGQIGNHAGNQKQETGKPHSHIIHKQLRTYDPAILTLPETLYHTPTLTLQYRYTNKQGHKHIAKRGQGTGLDTKFDQGEQFQPRKDHNRKTHKRTSGLAEQLWGQRCAFQVKPYVQTQ
jgi:hypothetical protein